MEPGEMALTRIKRSEVGGQQMGHVDECRLGRAVGHVAPLAYPAHGRGDVDDRGARRLQQQGRGLLGEGESGDHVEAEGVLQEARSGLHERRGHGATDIVDDDVEPAELLLGSRDENGRRFGIRSVQRQCDGAPAGGSDRGRDLVELRLGTGGDHHVSASLGESDRDGRTEPAARAGDDGDAVGQRKGVKDHAGGAASWAAASSRPSSWWPIRSRLVFR